VQPAAAADKSDETGLKAVMNCVYCREWNAEGEHRCRRCGRRLHIPSAPIGASRQPHSGSPKQPYSRGAVAEQPNPVASAGETKAAPSAHLPIPGRRPERHGGPVWQPPLFGTRDMGQVLPFDAFVPGTPQAERPVRPRARRLRARPVAANQQKLNFNPPVSASTARPAREPGTPYCNARVATLEHRSLAALIDFAFVALALGVFTAVLYGFGGDVLLNKQTAPIYLLAVAVVISLYRLLWCLGNGDGPGMRAMKLRLVDLDGHRPNRRKRFSRLFSGWLSFLAAGLGLLWAVADEESLTWHDHISGTFPTPRE